MLALPRLDSMAFFPLHGVVNSVQVSYYFPMSSITCSVSTLYEESLVYVTQRYNMLIPVNVYFPLTERSRSLRSLVFQQLYTAGVVAFY
jgi:hypothetical protein